MDSIEKAVADTMNLLAENLYTYRDGRYVRSMVGRMQYVTCPHYALRAETPLADHLKTKEEIAKATLSMAERIFCAEAIDVEMPELPSMEAEQCYTCTGIGKICECPVCGGSGEHSCCDCGAYHDCGKCHGSGRIPANGERTAKECPTCHGAGAFYAEHHVVQINGYPFAARLVEPFARIHQSVSVIPPSSEFKEDAAIAIFSGGGVSGIVCGLRIPVDVKERK